MANWVASVLAALLIGIPVLSAPAVESPQQIKHDIQQCYHLQAAALDAGNAKRYMNYCSKDFHDVGSQGAYTDYVSTLRLVHTTVTMVVHLRAQFNVLNIVAKGDREIVLCHEKMQGKVRDATGKLSSWSISGDVIDEWVHLPEGWRKIVSRSVRARTKIGGKRPVWDHQPEMWPTSPKRAGASTG